MNVLSASYLFSSLVKITNVSFHSIRWFFRSLGVECALKVLREVSRSVSRLFRLFYISLALPDKKKTALLVEIFIKTYIDIQTIELYVLFYS